MRYLWFKLLSETIKPRNAKIPPPTIIQNTKTLLKRDFSFDREKERIVIAEVWERGKRGVRDKILRQRHEERKKLRTGRETEIDHKRDVRQEDEKKKKRSGC